MRAQRILERTSSTKQTTLLSQFVVIYYPSTQQRDNNKKAASTHVHSIIMKAKRATTTNWAYFEFRAHLLGPLSTLQSSFPSQPFNTRHSINMKAGNNDKLCSHKLSRKNFFDLKFYRTSCESSFLPLFEPEEHDNTSAEQQQKKNSRSL